MNCPTCHRPVARAFPPVTPAQIRALRQSFGWTQRQLGVLASVSRVTIARWEAGVQDPNPAALKSLHSALSVRGITLATR